MFRFDRAELRSAASSAFRSAKKVRFQDVDAAGLVFFARYFEYVHDAYVEFLEQMGQPLEQVLRERAWAAPLRHAECDFVAPARFGDTLAIFLVAAHLDPTEMVLGFRVELEAGGTVALLQTVHTFVDLGTLERRPVPEALKEGLEPLTRLSSRQGNP